MEKKFKRTTVTSALPYANGPDIWLEFMYQRTSMCATCA